MVFPPQFFFWITIVGFLLSFVITPLVIQLAHYLGIVATSRYGGSSRSSIPLLGGLSLFVSLCIGIALYWPHLFSVETIAHKNIIGFLVGGMILVVGGFLDDKYSLPPKKQLIWPVLAIIAVVISGVGIAAFTNPFSPEKLIYVNGFQYDLVSLNGIPYRVTLPADIITFIWLAVIMYSTKLQDGLDGLVSGISFIGAIFIFLLSYFVFDDIPLAILSALFAGILLGFLKYNSYPAKIFLGESGSLITGFILGVLAILSDAKVIVTLLLLAIPITDAVWTVLRRLYNKQPPWKGDQEHLHHKLIRAGFSARKAAFLLYGITALFGTMVLLWQSSFTFYFTGVIILLIAILSLLFVFVYKRSS